MTTGAELNCNFPETITVDCPGCGDTITLEVTQVGSSIVCFTGTCKDCKLDITTCVEETKGPERDEAA